MAKVPVFAILIAQKQLDNNAFTLLEGECEEISRFKRL
jgi:hypothetical protein